MVIKYHDGNRYVWRDGIPRVTESFFDVSGGRSSGLYGTGIYAYLTIDRLLRENSKAMYAINVNDVKFFKPHSLDDVIELSKNLVEWVNGELKGADTSIAMKWAKKHADKINVFHKFYISMISLKEVIKWTIDEIKARGEQNASQPMNHLLRYEGFDGIEPSFESSNSNQFGIVIFKEYFELKNKSMQAALHPERHYIKPRENVTSPTIIKLKKITKDMAFVRKALTYENAVPVVQYYSFTDKMERYEFSEKIRMELYFKTKELMRKDNADDDKFCYYQQKIVDDDEMMQQLVDKVFKTCEERLDKKKCTAIKKYESERFKRA